MLDSIQQKLKQAMLDRDETQVSTLRLLISEINNTRIAKGKELDDHEIISVVQKEAKKRKESIEAFRKGDREDSALKEEAELKILEEYLPKQLSNEELTKIVEASITEVGANSIADIGKVMSSVMGEVAGQADGSVVSSIVRTKLQ